MKPNILSYCGWTTKKNSSIQLAKSLNFFYSRAKSIKKGLMGPVIWLTSIYPHLLPGLKNVKLDAHSPLYSPENCSSIPDPIIPAFYVMAIITWKIQNAIRKPNQWSFWPVVCTRFRTILSPPVYSHLPVLLPPWFQLHPLPPKKLLLVALYGS